MQPEDDDHPVSSALGWQAIPPPKQPRITEFERAKIAVNQLYHAISRGLGIDVARQLFVEIATPSTQREQDEWSRCYLLTAYIHLRQQNGCSHKDAVHELAELNKNQGYTIGVRRHTESAIHEAVRELLGKRPPKNASPFLLKLMEEAKKLHEGKRGRPKKKRG